MDANVPGPVLAAGELLIDFIVADGASSLHDARSFAARAGGAPANVAVALARLGVPSAFCGVVGDDPFGQRLSAELGREGVDTSRIRRTKEAPTTVAYAWKDKRGDGHFWLNRGADIHLSRDDITTARIGQVAALVVGSVSLAAIPIREAVEEAVDEAQKAAVPVVFDVNLRPSVWADPRAAPARCERLAIRSTIVKLSLDDARGVIGQDTSAEAAVSDLLALGPRAVVLTDGDRGSWFASQSRPHIEHVAAFPVAAIEPTGAGDAFLAALILRLRERDWEEPSMDDIRYASAAGALATTQPGAWDGLPSRTQLEAFLASM